MSITNRTRILVTDRGPGWPLAGFVHRSLVVAPIGSDGAYGLGLAARWRAAGVAVHEPIQAEDAVGSGVVRSLLTVDSDDDGYTVIGLQREAVLAPEWQRILSWLPAALADGCSVVADVRPDWLGAVEAATDATPGLAVRAVRRFRVRYSLAWFLFVEWLAKAIVGRTDAHGDCDVLFYAEVPNHWRQLGPVAAVLVDRGLRVGFLSAAVESAFPFVPPGFAGRVRSLDRAAISPSAAIALLGATFDPPRAAVRGNLSSTALRALDRRARHCWRVYEKSRACASRLECRVCVMGDAASHRPAGVAHALAVRGIPTVAMQHGAVADPVRYLQQSDVFLVWDDDSRRRVAEAGGLADAVVVGIPTLDMIGKQSGAATGTDLRGCTVFAPTYKGEVALEAWVRLALEAVDRSPWARNRRILRLHPRTLDAVRDRVAEWGLVKEVVWRTPLADDFGRAAVVVTEESSVAVEASAAGVPVFVLDARGVLAPVHAIPHRPGAADRAADAIVAVMGVSDAS